MKSNHSCKAVIGSLVMLMGCGPAAEPESGVLAWELIGDGDDAQRGHGRFIEVARQCDPSAQVETIDACGRSVPGNAHLSWVDCRVALPEGARADEIVTSGSFDLSSSLAGSCDDGSASLTRTAQFQIDRQIADGVTAHIEGNSVSTRSSAGQTISLNVTRSMSRAGASAGGSVSGDLQVSADLEGQRVLNGTISFSMSNPRFGLRSGSVTLENVVRVSREECRWPVGGTMTRSMGDQSKVIVFSETCGQATIDGEPVSLDEHAASFGQQRRGGGAQRPY